MSTRAQLIADMNAKIISGSRSTTAANLRAFETGMINSNVNKTDDLDVVNGYLGISSLGIVNIGFIKKTSPTGEFLKDDGTWSSVLTSVPTLSQVLTAGNTSGANNILFSSGQGIDNGSFGVVLNIGATNAGVINYGNASTIHNFLGTAIYELQVNSYVTDKLITLNYGGSLASGIGVGFEIEENSVITGYWKTNSSRDGWVTKLPAVTNTGTFDFSTVTGARIWSMPNATGTLALTSDITSAISGTTNYLSKFTAANTIGNSLVYDDGTYVGIGLTNATFKFQIKGAGTTNATSSFAVQDSTGKSAIEVYDDGRIQIHRTNYASGLNSALVSIVDNTWNFDWNFELYNLRTTGNPFGQYIEVSGATAGVSTALKLNANNGVAANSFALQIANGHAFIAAGSNNFSLGTSGVNANYKFEVKGVDNTSSNYALVAQSTTSYLFTVRNDGFVGVGSAAPISTETFNVNGNVYFNTVLNGTWNGASISTAYTDAKIKGSVAATSGLIPYGTGTADTVTTNTNFLFDSSNTGLVIGTTALFDTASIATFRKDQNARTMLSVINGTNGTGALSAFITSVSSSLATQGTLASFAASYTTSGMFIANTTCLHTNMTGGLVIGTNNASGISYYTNNTLVAQMTSTGIFNINTVGTNGVSFQGLVGTTTSSAIYLNQSSPSSTNFALASTAAGSTSVNGASNVILQYAGANRLIVNSNGWNATSGQGAAGTSLFQFTTSNNSSQTAGTNVPKFIYTIGTTQWLTGALAQADFVQWTQPSVLFVAASTATLASTFTINGAPIASTNATITTSVGLLINIGTTLSGSVTTGYAAYFNAPTGATTNYALGLNGSINILDGFNIVTGTTTGTIIAATTSQKLGLWGATPVIQQAHADQGAVTTTVATTAATNVAPFGYTTAAQANDLITEVGQLKVLVNRLRTDLVTIGAIKGSA